MSGEADLDFNDATTLSAGASTGKIRLLAVAGDSRVPQFPDVPTTAEAGAPGYTDQNYVGLYVAGGTSPEIVERLHTAVNKVLATPEVAARLNSLGYLPAQKSQQDFDTFYRGEIARWKDVAQKAHIPPVD
jgi:tripartite-type tricarboxylate transporter receptor subunit TctC